MTCVCFVVGEGHVVPHYHGYDHHHDHDAETFYSWTMTWMPRKVISGVLLHELKKLLALNLEMV